MSKNIYSISSYGSGSPPLILQSQETLTLYWKYETYTHIIRCDNPAKKTGKGTWYQENKKTKTKTWWVGSNSTVDINPILWKKEYWQQHFEFEKDVS